MSDDERTFGPFEECEPDDPDALDGSITLSVKKGEVDPMTGATTYNCKVGLLSGETGATMDAMFQVVGDLPDWLLMDLYMGVLTRATAGFIEAVKSSDNVVNVRKEAITHQESDTEVQC